MTTVHLYIYLPDDTFERLNERHGRVWLVAERLWYLLPVTAETDLYFHVVVGARLSGDLTLQACLVTSEGGFIQWQTFICIKKHFLLLLTTSNYIILLFVVFIILLRRYLWTQVLLKEKASNKNLNLIWKRIGKSFNYNFNRIWSTKLNIFRIFLFFLFWDQQGQIGNKWVNWTFWLHDLKKSEICPIRCLSV